MMITFEGIRRIYEEERRNNDLSELPENFFEEIRRYINNLLDSKSTDELETVKRRLDSIFEIRERKIVNGSLDFVRSDVEPQNMTGNEELLFRNIVASIEGFRTETAKLIKGKEPVDDETYLSEKEETDDKDEKISSSDENSSEKNADIEEYEKKESDDSNKESNASHDSNKENKTSDLVIVDFKEYIHEFVGTDLKRYGPFRKGELGNIPKDNADMLHRTGKAEIVKTRD